jgi:CheY-like chemotaxis protein/anti-sigma regulatory factor (Ser/Thr protein kinase)
VSLTSEIHANAQTVIGDADRLQQVVWNLLANAVKFTPRGGQVRLRVSKGESQIDLVVVDDGRGIERDFLPFVFDRFRQAEGGSTREHGGLGLGLAIVRHFTEAHGGTVSAESDGAGSGATFRVSLPVGAAAKELPPLSSRANESIEPPPPPQQVLDGLRILVVDDEEDARELLGLVLRQYGAHVSEAHAAKQGLSALGTARFDVIVSDIGMPGEDGHAFIRQVRSLGTKERASRTPAIALTAYARIDDRRKALAAGFQMHLAKPIKAASLVAAVAQLGGRGVLLP